MLKKMAVMRTHMRALQINKEPDLALLEQFGMTEKEVYDTYRLLAIAKYEDRFVIPPAHREEFSDLYFEQGACGFTDMMGGPGTMRRLILRALLSNPMRSDSE